MSLLTEPTSPCVVPGGTDVNTAVLVYAKDPISRAGVASQLAGWPGIVLLDPRQGQRADVAVVVAEAVDDEVLRVIRTIRRGSGAEVVVVVNDSDVESIMAAADAGASGALPRRSANGELLAGVVGKVRRGQAVLPPRPSQAAHRADDTDQEATSASPATTHALSTRDVEVLRLLAEGCDTAEIAQRLAYSEPTIKNVIQRLFEQLKARNRPHAVALALRTGII